MELSDRTLVWIMAIVLALVIGLVGGYFIRFSIDKSTTAPSSPPVSTPSGTGEIGRQVDLTGTSGSALHATLESFAVDSNDESALNLCLNGDMTPYYAQILLNNSGASALSAPGTGIVDSIGVATTVVDSSATPYAINGCNHFSYTTDATAGCQQSATSVSLAPGDTAVVCPVFLLPSSAAPGEVQFNASQAFAGFGSGASVAVWHLASG